MSAPHPCYAAAVEAARCGIGVLPVKQDGTKAPALSEWTKYQERLPTGEELEDWFADGRQSGIWVSCGKVSGNLEMFEAESEALWAEFGELVQSAGLGELWQRVTTGYESISPGGGHHAMYRCDTIEGNTKLARRPLGDKKVDVLFETRGEGGGAVEPPSNGRVHETGGQYRQVRGGFASIATITPEERRALHDVARTFDEMPKQEAKEGRTFAAAGSGTPGAGTDYNDRGDVVALLEDHGWTRVYTKNGEVFLRRPDKKRGISATFGYGGTRYLYVFSTATVFDAERAYSPFAVYAILEHGGDFSAAAKALADAGYGYPEPEITRRRPAGAEDVPWPTLDDAAYYGLAGDIVRTIAPHTEGDPVALLTTAIVMFGAAAGRSPYAAVGATRHYANEFAVTVGKSGRARKGTAANEIKAIIAGADPRFTPRTMGGLSSGEGLINAVRDPVFKPDREGNVKCVDPGVEDKRLLALEPEFSSVLRVASRDGSTISENLRRAWDGNDLGTLTRASPLVATSPHISLLGHITQDELRRELSETAQVNGFANRHLFLCVRRSQELPHGGCVLEAEIAVLTERVRRALDAARRRGRMARDAETNRMWEAVYSALTAERPGMLGSITARAEAHVLRLSLLYALMDEADAIRRPHLEAALALWQYAENSARFIFGDATGDPLADRVLAALRANGPMSQNELVDLFGRHVAAARLGAALETLVRNGLIRSTREETGGRPRTTWEAIR